jgi:hypothetical protein
MGRRARQRAELELSVLEALVLAFGLVISVVTFVSYGRGLGLAAGAAGVALAAYVTRHRRWARTSLTTVAVLLGALALAVLVGAHFHNDHPAATVRPTWDRSPTDLASATEPEGLFPARPGLVCDAPPACGTGETPALDTLVFGDAGFPQGVRDERRFLRARVVLDPRTHLLEDLRPGHDPLRVTPGDTIEITGIVDNAATPGRAGSTAHGARALIELPSGSGMSHAVLSSVSAANAVPTAVSDSVTIESTMPIYLRYRLGSASVTRQGSPLYALPDQLVNTYRQNQLDRRQLAGHGVRLGCQEPDGNVPAGRACALEFRALFDVRYAATPHDVNGISGLDDAQMETAGRVNGRAPVPLYWSPRWGSISDLSLNGGDEASVDCAIFGLHGTWYHLADAVSHPRHPELGLDTAFIPARAVTIMRGFVTECSR